VCEPECPIDAIQSDTTSGMEPWIELNRNHARLWPNITEKGQPPANAKAMEGRPDKLRDLFSALPGEGT
ncbi:MAG: DUF3470 domain-containing protein, partial [Alphaproteobacteria bacterium]|nr:DUF3470 domain-containing protein [Alphaproteobacteria bacterium]